MKSSDASRTPDAGLSAGQIALGVFGLVAPVVTFLLAISSAPDSAKVAVLVVLAAAYSCVCLWAFRKSTQANKLVDNDDPAESEDQELAQAFASIGEASEFFGASLKPSDVFRLVSNRVGQIFPFTTSALFIESESGESLQIIQADGLNAQAMLNTILPVDKGIAGMAWLSGDIEIDSDLGLESDAMPDEAIAGLRSAIAMPLVHNEQAFAVFVLYKDERLKVDDTIRATAHAIGERVAPLFLSSISFERSISNALTDSVTNLPNERAFFMVLENQLAESQRFRSERPLTVMSVDIKNFSDANQSFGFAAGDRILAFAAENLSSQLRKMDFLSRSVNDEFLIILPTASEKFASEIMQRIKNHFAAEIFSVSESEDIKVWLNFGWATFWQDGETADQLLQHARIRKQQSKAEEPSKVLWFPKEYVN